MNLFTRVSALAAGSTLAVGVLTAPAMAATSVAPAYTPAASTLTLAQAKTLAKAKIDGRLSEMRALQLAVGQASNLSTATQSALSSMLSTNTAALNALRTQMANELTVQAVSADVVTMENYHVYLLDAPQVRLSVTFADNGVALTRLQGSYTNLAADVAKKNGNATAAEQALLVDLQTQITAVQNALSGQEAALLALQPAMSATLISEVGQIQAAENTAQAALTQGATDVTTLRTDL